jgi:hypothetical protein
MRGWKSCLRGKGRTVVQYFRNPRDRSRRALLAGGGGLAPDYEYQTLKKAYGKFTLEVDLGGLGGVVSDPFDWSAGSPSAATLQTALNTMLGSGRAEVTDGAVYQIKFVGDLAEYDLPELTLTADSSYPLNDATGTAPTKLGQSNYVEGAQERITLALTPNDPGANASAIDSNGNSITYDFATTLYTTTAGGDFTCISGVNSSSATFESASDGPKNTTYSIMSENNGTPGVTIDVAGAIEANAQVNVTFTGAAGWITYASSSPSFSFAIPVTALDAAALAILNDAARYNGTVDSVAMGSTSMTVNFTATNNPGAVTIGGVTGAAVTSAVDTLQDGANALPSSLPTPVMAISFASPYVFQTVGGAAAVSDGDPVGSALATPPTTIDGSQATSGSRPSFIAAGGATFDGTGDYVSLGTSTTLQPSVITITMWLRRTVSWNGAESCIAWLKPNATFNGSGWYLTIDDRNFGMGNRNQSPLMAVDGINGFYCTGSPDTLFPLNTWTHLAVTFNSSTNAKAIFINGVSQSLSSLGVPDSITATSDTKYMGFNSPGYAGGFLGGAIKDARIYSVVLTQDEIDNVIAGHF